ALLVAFLFVVLLIGVAETSSPVVDVSLLIIVTGGLWLLLPRTAQERERLRERLYLASWSTRDRERLTAAIIAPRAAEEAWMQSMKAAILARLLPDLGSGPLSLRVGVLPNGRLPAGLRESHDSSYHVQTDTGRHLATLIRDLQGGSFALVGARGTGKS